MKPQLFWIDGPWKGHLAVATRPRGGDWLNHEFAGLRLAGIDKVVSLLEGEEAAQLELSGESAAAVANGIRFVSFPIPDRGLPVSTDAARLLVEQIEDGLAAGENVAVHCRQGIGRSGMIAAAILLSTGLAPDEAMRAVSAARGLPIPETPAQIAWLQRLAAYYPAPAHH